MSNSKSVDKKNKAKELLDLFLNVLFSSFYVCEEKGVNSIPY
jgi:NTP pyrophosphatase (non-canonical NTP hydrolase)